MRYMVQHIGDPPYTSLIYKLLDSRLPKTLVDLRYVFSRTGYTINHTSISRMKLNIQSCTSTLDGSSSQAPPLPDQLAPIEDSYIELAPSPTPPATTMDLQYVTYDDCFNLIQRFDLMESNISYLTNSVVQLS